MIFIILAVGLVVYIAVRGLIVWADRQPYEDALWPGSRGIGGPGGKTGL